MLHSLTHHHFTSPAERRLVERYEAAVLLCEMAGPERGSVLADLYYTVPVTVDPAGTMTSTHNLPSGRASRDTGNRT